MLNLFTNFDSNTKLLIIPFILLLIKFPFVFIKIHFILVGIFVIFIELLIISLVNSNFFILLLN